MNAEEMEVKPISINEMRIAKIVSGPLSYTGFTVMLFLISSAVCADERRFEVCRSKLKQAQKLEVLYDLDWKSGREPRVVAGRTFFTMPIDAKEGFVETVNCFLMTGKKQCVNFNVLHWQTGKTVGRFSNCRFKMN